LSILRTPSGTKDVLPTEAAELRLIEDAATTIFREFGYGEVRTPTLEHEEVMALSHEASLLTGFRLLDERGQLLLLRPDLTAPIARLVGSRFGGQVGPHRVFSVSKIFRRIPEQRGLEAEFRQAGIELLGSEGASADAEVIAVACRVLERAGLREYRVGLGQLAFFLELLTALVPVVEDREALTRELVGKDFVGFRLLAEALDLSTQDRQSILAVPELRGGAEVLSEAREHVRSQAMQDALDRLVEVQRAVAIYGYAERLLFDFGIFRNLAYYTGLVFEVYAPELGATLGGGGRYDNLLERFGRAMPAVGFGLALDRVHAALVSQSAELSRRVPMTLLVGGLDRHVELAEELRAAGLHVFSLAENSAPAEVQLLARQKEADFLLEPADASGAEWWLVDLHAGLRERHSGRALLARLRDPGALGSSGSDK